MNLTPRQSAILLAALRHIKEHDVNLTSVEYTSTFDPQSAPSEAELDEVIQEISANQGPQETWVIAFGNANTGLRLLGPFPSADAAQELASRCGLYPADTTLVLVHPATVEEITYILSNPF